MRLLRPLILLLLPSAALADSFEGFRIPEHRVFSWTGSLTASAGHHDQEGFYEIKNGQVQGSIGTAASWLYDSDARLTSFSLDLGVGGNRNGMEQNVESFSAERVRESSATERWSVYLRHRQYPWSVPLGLELQVATSGTYLQNWSNVRTWTNYFWVDSIEDNRASAQRKAYDYRVYGSAELGVGRVRDATAVYDVWVLEDRLRSRGVLRGPLSAGTRERLAALMYNTTSYGVVLDRPGRTFWEDLIGILKQDENYADTWDPVAALRVLEPYFGPDLSSRFVSRSPITRDRGWFAGVTSLAGYSSLTEHGASSSFRQLTLNDTVQPATTTEIATSNSDHQTSIFVGPRVEWHRPMGPHWQVDALTQQIFDTKGAGRMFSETGVLVSWLVTDRWLATVNASHDLSLFREPTGTFANQVWRVSLRGDLSWFLEDHLLLTLSGAANHLDFQGTHGNDYHASLSLGYRFAGRLQNPGLTSPISVP